MSNKSYGEEREQRTAQARKDAGFTVGHNGAHDAETVAIQLAVYIEPMRSQLRLLNTEIGRIHGECKSYYGCNLDTRYCVEYNSAVTMAHRLRLAIEKLEGER